MLKLDDDYLIIKNGEDSGFTSILTTADIKKEVKERTKEEGREVYFVDVAKEYTLVGMDERGNGYYV